jgi:hypothetical protein
VFNEWLEELELQLVFYELYCTDCVYETTVGVTVTEALYCKATIYAHHRDNLLEGM